MTKHYEQRKEANKRYLEKQDELKIRVPGGQKVTIEAAAAAAGVSVNRFVRDAVLARMGLSDWPAQDKDEQ